MPGRARFAMGMQVYCGDWHATEDAGDAFQDVIAGVESFISKEEAEDWTTSLSRLWTSKTRPSILKIARRFR
jgi:hypothetical protein